MLMDLTNDATTQGELDLEPVETRDRTKLMMAMDALNGRYGRGTVHVGSAARQHTQSDWSMRQERLTPQYTTNWSDMPVA
jgi:DNA polymerase V